MIKNNKVSIDLVRGDELPTEYRSETQSRQLTTTSITSDQYFDPSVWYEEPIRNHALSINTVTEENIESIKPYTTIVNINYFWK